VREKKKTFENKALAFMNWDMRGRGFY